MESNNSTISGTPENTESGSPTPKSTSLLTAVPSAPPATNGGFTRSEPSSGNFVGSRRKRGRPRKYDAQGNLNPSYASSSRISSPLPSRAVSPPPGFSLTTSFVFEGPRRGPGKFSATSSLNNWNYQPSAIGGMFANTEGMDFTAHIIRVQTGEDISAKIHSIGSNGPRSVCVLSAIGDISNVTIRQTELSGGLCTYEGRFQLLSLIGSYIMNEIEGVTTTTGGLSVLLAGPDGRVIGGKVAGWLIAGSPVQMVIGTFIPCGYMAQKGKQPLISPTAAAIPAFPDTMPAEIPNLQSVSLGNEVGAPEVPPMPVQTQGEVDDNIIDLEEWNNKSQPPLQERMYPDINVSVPDE